MESNQLQLIITQLESNLQKKEAYFQVSEYSSEGNIKANKDGLMQAAVDLLKATNEFNVRQFENGKEEFYLLDNEWEAGDHHSIFKYIELINKSKTELNLIDSEDINETWQDKILPVGCIILIIFGLFLLLTGFGTVMSWV